MFKNPVVYSMKDYRNIIKAKHNWDKNNVYADRVMLPIEEHIRDEFDKKCFYCRSRIREGNSSGQTEHIVHKGEYKIFTFRPENLVLSCPKCNTYKSTSETLSTGLRGKVFRYSEYPQNPSDFTIIHAYFDDYDSHIELIKDIFYSAKRGSSKGTETIKMFNLHRLQLAEDKAIDKLDLLETLSFSYLYREGTDEEIKARMEDLLSMPFESAEHFFRTIASLSGNKTVSDLVSYLDRLGNTQSFNLISRKNINLFNCLYQFKQQFSDYVDLIITIETNKKVKEKVLTFIRSQGIPTRSNIETFCFTEESLELLRTNIDNNLLGIDGRSLPKLKRSLLLVPNTKKEIRKLIFFHKELELLLNLFNLFYLILKSKKISSRVQRLYPQLLEDMKTNLNEIGHFVNFNPQLIIVSKLELIYSVKDLSVSTLKDINSVLKSCPRL
jgi:hypothetical protein